MVAWSLVSPVFSVLCTSGWYIRLSCLNFIFASLSLVVREMPKHFRESDRFVPTLFGLNDEFRLFSLGLGGFLVRWWGGEGGGGGLFLWLF